MRIALQEDRGETQSNPNPNPNPEAVVKHSFRGRMCQRERQMLGISRILKKVNISVKGVA